MQKETTVEGQVLACRRDTEDIEKTTSGIESRIPVFRSVAACLRRTSVGDEPRRYTLFPHPDPLPRGGERGTGMRTWLPLQTPRLYGGWDVR